MTPAAICPVCGEPAAGDAYHVVLLPGLLSDEVIEDAITRAEREEAESPSSGAERWTYIALAYVAFGNGRTSSDDVALGRSLVELGAVLAEIHDGCRESSCLDDLQQLGRQLP